jgi:hypothetical protein
VVRCNGLDRGGLIGRFNLWVIECVKGILVSIGSLVFNRMFDPFCDGLIRGCIS